MIVVMIPGQENAEMDFQLDSNEDDPEQVGREIEEAAKQVGLIDGSSTINVIDLDSPKTAALIPTDRVQTQKIELKGKTYEAAAVILMRDRDKTLEAMSNGQQVKVEVRSITFSSPTGRVELLNVQKSGEMDLLAIVMPDGLAKYLVKESHLPFAENIAREIDLETLRRMPTSNEGEN